MLEKLLDGCELLYTLEKYGELIEKCDEVLEMDTDNPAALNYKAISLYYLKKYDESLDLLNYSLKLHPKNHYTLNNKALVYIALKEYDKALECCEDGLKSREFDWLQINKIESLIHLGRVDEAHEYFKSVKIPYYTFEEALDNCGKGENDIKAIYEKVDELFKQKKFEEIIELCDGLEVNEKILNYKIFALAYLRRFYEAIDCVNGAIDQYPYNYNFYFIKARIALFSGNFDLAIETYEKAFRINGLSNNRLEINDYINCLERKANSLINEGKYDEAVENIEKIIKIKGEKR